MSKKQKWIKLNGGIDSLKIVRNSMLKMEKREREDNSIVCLMYSNGNGKRRSRKGSLWASGWK